MFDFFKDSIDEFRGIDVVAEKQRKVDMIKKERAERYIFTKRSRIIVTIIGALFVLVALAGTSISVVLHETNLPIIIFKNIFLCLLDIATIIVLWKKGKPFEISAVVGIILFMVFNYIFMYFMYFI